MRNKETKAEERNVHVKQKKQKEAKKNKSKKAKKMYNLHKSVVGGLRFGFVDPLWLGSSSSELFR